MAKIIEEFCEEYGYSYRNDYSGRCMYGRCCVGIVCQDVLETLVQLCQYIVDTSDDVDLQEVLGSPRQDSMGLDSIIYFPAVSEKDEEE